MTVSQPDRNPRDGGAAYADVQQTKDGREDGGAFLQQTCIGDKRAKGGG